MALTIDVIYDGKVLKPQEPLSLAPNEHYTVTIEEQPQPQEQGPPKELSDAAWQIYDERLKALLEPQYNGKIAAVHLGAVTE